MPFYVQEKRSTVIVDVLLLMLMILFLEVSDCTMVSSVHTFKKNSQYKICIDTKGEDHERNCTKRLLSRPDSYATINGTSDCLMYKYKGAECTKENETFGDEVTNITHKS